jgi:hypothetical protein
VNTSNDKPSTPEIPADAFLMQVAFSPLLTQALYVAAKLGIADLLAEKPQPISQLSMATKTHERALYRVLRSLASIGVFQEIEAKVFGLTPYAEALRTEAPGSVRNGIIFMGEAWHWNVWGQLLQSVKTGKPSWAEVHGAEVFDYFAGQPTESEIFNRAMTDMSVSTAPAVIETYDFSEFTTLVDIAGGHGYLLAQILKANPQLSGVLFDVPSVIAGASALLEQEGVSERIETVAGDFFKGVPANADAYIMKHIIHDWDDEQAIAILRNIRQAVQQNGKALLVETVVPDGNEAHYSKLLDLEMLVSPGGVERTAEEYRELFAAAGFRLTRIVPTASPYSIIEAVPE